MSKDKPGNKKVNNNLRMSHDSYFKKSMSDIRVARDFFTHNLPAEVVEKVDLTTLKPTKDTFVDRDLKQYLTDMLFTVNIDKEESYLYILIEHISSTRHASNLLPFRINHYVFKILEQYINHTENSQNKEKPTTEIKLPLVLPILLYHGKQSPYPYSTDMYDACYHKELAKKYMFKLILIDLTQKSEEELHKQGYAALMQYALKVVYVRDIVKELEEYVIIKSEFEYYDKDQKLTFIGYLIYRADSEDTKGVLEVFEPHLTADEKEDAMTIAQRLRQEGRQEGEHTGFEKGIARVVANMLSEKFSATDIAKSTGMDISDIKRMRSDPKDSD
ncbi:MAG: hypothetical protein COC15_01600 [Legionellales bacterium]|nr:MAG: hypothetical protein COC15_01600 [Legionellales bacterium]